MMSMLVAVAVGAVLGAGLGYFGQCTSGTCPLTSTWWRGALYGAALGAVVAYGSGPSGAFSSAKVESINVAHVTESDFDAQVLRSAQPVLVDFYAPWCGPCKILSPTVAKLADEYAGRVKVVKVNVDNAAGLADRFQIRGIPTLVFFQAGKPVDTVVGLISEQQLRARLQTLASGAAAKTAQVAAGDTR